MVKKRITNEAVTEAEQIVVSTVDAQELEPQEEVDSEYSRLLEAVQEIRQNHALLGYILRSEDKATVDLDEPTRIVEYALLSSQALDSSETLAESFDLGALKSVMVEGTQSKAFCLSMGGYKLALFLEKNADQNVILKSLPLDQA